MYHITIGELRFMIKANKQVTIWAKLFIMLSMDLIVVYPRP